MLEVTIYTKVGCPYCAAAKKHYSEQGIAFREIDVNDTPGAKDKVLDLTRGQRMVPVIVEQGEVKIGFGGG
ncbi:MAG: glutaredoxin family protein [candidate division Zixibacteria bacterium]|nr:glutaredoxin family protein [candidate division Zixibacteria bacterium]MCK4606613.1 glutaredoxin family protein [candidate division Zixibacteria bacterium]